MTLARVVLRSACALMLGTTVGAQGPASNAISDTVTTQITQLEHQVEAAFQRADSAFLNNALGEDFRFRHANRWIGRSLHLSRHRTLRLADQTVEVFSGSLTT